MQLKYSVHDKPIYIHFFKCNLNKPAKRMYHANTQTREFFNQKCKAKQGKKVFMESQPAAAIMMEKFFFFFYFVAVHIFYFCYLVQVPVQLTF